MHFTTRELTARTWPDFEDLFTRGNGCDFCACMFFQRGRPLPSSRYRSRALMAVQNRAEKHDLVLSGRAHGILVYAEGYAIGWCQFGPIDELPIGGRSHLGPTDADWRITCLVTDPAHRNLGVSRRALRAALSSIRRRGGGLVESYPIVWETTDALREQFPDCVATELGLANTRHRGAYRQLGSMGTVAMFEAEGFVPVRTHDDRRLVVQRSI